MLTPEERKVRPVDRPDQPMICNICGKTKPETHKNFEVYESRGLYYRRPTCRICINTRKSTTGKELIVKDQLEALIGKHIEATGKIPSCRGLARLLGRSDDRTLRHYWDELHAEGRAPERPGFKGKRTLTPEELENREGGRLLLDIETRLRGVMYEIGKANPEYKENARNFWISHLENISRLTEEAMEMATGEMLDDLLLQITENEGR
jgi:hypothetical protein